MKKLTVLLAVVVVAMLGCSSDSGKDAADTAAGMTDKAQEAADATQAHAEAAMMTVEGKTGCGHCTFKKGTGCSAAVQTADGTIYVLEGVGQDTELYKKRQDGVAVRVTGTVMEKDGDTYLVVASHEML